MLDRDHFAADIAVIWSKARVIECNVRSRPNHKLYRAIDDMAELMLETEQLIKTWEDKIGSRRAYKRDVATDNDEGE